MVGPSWAGDMVMAQSLFATLRAAGEVGAIDVLAPDWSRPLIARMPEVRASVTLPLAHGELGLSVRRRIGRELRGRGYRRAIVLPRSFKAALIPFFARVPRRTGFLGEMRFGLINDFRPLDKNVLAQTVRRYVSLGLESGAPQPPAVPPPRLRVDGDNQRRLLAGFGLERRRPVIGMMPGAEYGPAKCWPVGRFAALAKRLTSEGRQVWVMGSDKDSAAGHEIVAACASGAVNLCGRTRLEDAVDLLALTDVAVTNDSGLMHVAAAVGTGVVAIYGSSTPDFTPPLTSRARIVYHRLECSPCFARECPLGHYECLRGIAVDEVYRALP